MSRKTLLIAGAGLVVAVFLLSGLAGVLTAIFGRGEPAGESLVRTPSPPNLQIAPRQDLEDYLATQRASLNSYGWVDEEAGRVRIPIERAMELLAERGLPVEPRESGPPDALQEDESGFDPTAAPTAAGEETP